MYELNIVLLNDYAQCVIAIGAMSNTDCKLQYAHLPYNKHFGMSLNNTVYQ
jgi:hypothetical protein